mmetsp:Transcript_60604/g.132728  ORF Transcript_60604/g.132728 Transcript_60604/m.132728 type:complete len:204 (-) Transcript_60604:961-1572(-)
MDLHAGGPLKAGLVLLWFLKGVKGHHFRITAISPAGFGIAVIFQKEPRLKNALGIGELVQALVRPNVLAPPTRARAVALLLVVQVPVLVAILGAFRAPVQLGRAVFRGRRQTHQGTARKDLQRSVQAVFAVVQVHPAPFHLRSIALQNGSEAVHQENRVRIHLENPVMIQVLGVTQHLLPHHHEGTKIENRHEGTAELTHQSA